MEAGLGCSQNCQTKHLSWAIKTSSRSLLPALPQSCSCSGWHPGGQDHFILFEFFCLPQRPLNRRVHKRNVPARGLQRTQCIGGVVWCVVAQAERERLLRQSNCSLLPLLPILTQPACIKTPAVHCAGESPHFSLDSLCGTSWFQSTHMLMGQTIESNALQKISTDKELLCREGPRVYLT